MKLRYTPRAAQDLTGVADHIREHNPAAAMAVVDGGWTAR